MKQHTAYQGNINLKRRGIIEEYTEEQVKELLKCKKDPIYFIENYIHIINLDEGLVKFKLYPFQKRLIKMLHNDKRIIGKAPRQVGKTVTVSAYFCHYIIFNDNKTAAILGNKDKTAREILYKIKIMFENLPSWLKPGVEEWNKGSVEFENGSRIVTAATSSSSIRGMALNIILLDEFAFISSGVFEDFIQSVYPTVSSSKKSKIIMISTPWGLNHFYKFWTEAVKGRNGYSFFEINWNDLPGRNKKWKDEMIAEIGEERFRQEFNAEFIGSSSTLISTNVLKNMVYSDPIATQLDNKFIIYQKPTKDRQYVLFCDVAEGVGGDSSTIQVTDVTELPYQQVAVFEDNLVKTNIFASVINTIGTSYNNALVVVENNSIGETVLNCLNFDQEYDNLFFNNKKFGLRMTKGSKRIGCGHLKTFIETDKLIIHDLGTIKQFTEFEKKKNGTFSAEKNKHDDLVTPFILFSAFMANDGFVEYWLEKEKVMSDIYSKAMKEIEDNLLPIGFFPENMETEDKSYYYEG